MAPYLKAPNPNKPPNAFEIRSRRIWVFYQIWEILQRKAKLNAAGFRAFVGRKPFWN